MEDQNKVIEALNARIAELETVLADAESGGMPDGVTPRTMTDNQKRVALTRTLQSMGVDVAEIPEETRAAMVHAMDMGIRGDATAPSVPAYKGENINDHMEVGSNRHRLFGELQKIEAVFGGAIDNGWPTAYLPFHREMEALRKSLADADVRDDAVAHSFERRISKIHRSVVMQSNTHDAWRVKYDDVANPKDKTNGEKVDEILATLRSQGMTEDMAPAAVKSMLASLRE